MLLKDQVAAAAKEKSEQEAAAAEKRGHAAKLATAAEARDQLHFIGRAFAEEPLQSLAVYPERLCESALRETVAKEQEVVSSANQFKRKREAELETLRDELCVEHGAKQQMAQRIVEKRAAVAPPAGASGNAEVMQPPDAALVAAADAAVAPPAGTIASVAAVDAPGVEYTGDFDADGQYHGIGRSSTQDGAIYVGQFQHGRKHGKGKLKTMDGVVYIGEFADDQQHGFGVVTAADGGRGYMKFAEGRVQGPGVAESPDGTWEAGDMNEIGEVEGYGIAKVACGTVGLGFWRDAEFIIGKQKNSLSMDVAVKGTFDSDGRLHGYGQLERAGEVQQGLFEHGVVTWLATA